LGSSRRQIMQMNSESPVAIDAELLVIGYGNSLRRDDGVGPRVAEAIEDLHLPGVRTLVCPLLSPEHADPIARARRVIFVDAAVDRIDGVHLRKLEAGETSQLMAHAADPRTMLALARDVFGRTPEAWWLTIPAIHLGFGTDYSAEAEAGFQTAVTQIKQLAAEGLKSDANNCTSPGNFREAGAGKPV